MVGLGLSAGCSQDKPASTMVWDSIWGPLSPGGSPRGNFHAFLELSQQFLHCWALPYGLNIPCGVLCSSSHAMVSLALITKWCSPAAVVFFFQFTPGSSLGAAGSCCLLPSWDLAMFKSCLAASDSCGSQEQCPIGFGARGSQC